jgi:hypothetical protein
MPEMVRRLITNEAVLTACLYALLISLVYFPIVFLGKTLLPSLYSTYGVTDAGPYKYEGRKPVNTFNIDLATPAYYENPINRLVGDTYLRGELPLWNPYQASGTPLAAQYSTRAFFPYQIMENLTPYWMWDFFMLGRLWVAGIFTFLFLRTLGLSFVSSFLGGMFYMFSGSMTWFINLEQFVNVAMLVPLAMFAAEKLMQTLKNRYTALTGIVLALVLLAGQPETALYLILLSVTYILFRLAKLRKNGIEMKPTMIRLVVSGILGFGLSAPVWFLFLEFMNFAHHIHPIGGKMGVGTVRLFNATAIISPTLFDLPIPFPKGPKNGAWDLLGGYSGFLAFYLAILGMLFRSRHNGHALFFGLFGLCVLLKNFGFPIVTWIGYLPLFDQVWTPRWAGPIWTFGFSVAGAVGLETGTKWLSERDKKPELSPAILRVTSNLKQRFHIDQINHPKIAALICLCVCALLLTGYAFSKAFRDHTQMMQAIEGLGITDEAKKEFKELIDSDTRVVDIVQSLDVGPESKEGFRAIYQVNRRFRAIWKIFCLEAILLFILLHWYRRSKSTEPTPGVMRLETPFSQTALISCLCLAALYLLSFTDLAWFLSNLTPEQMTFFIPSALSGFLVTSSVIATIIVLPTLFHNKQSIIYAIVGLGIAELSFFIPKGYDAHYAYWKLIPFVAAILGVYALAKKHWRWAASAFLCMVALHALIDIKAPHGLPDRNNPFRVPPYVDFIEKNIEYGRILALDGTLMPNFSSALGLHDIRYVNALTSLDYHRLMGHLLSFYYEQAHDSSSLWFTGIPGSQDSVMLEESGEFWENLPYCRLLGVKFILTPHDIRLSSLPSVYEGEVNVFELPSPLPRVFVAHQAEYATFPDAAIDRVRSLGAAMGNKVIIEKAIPEKYTNDMIQPAGDSSSHIEEYTSNRVVIRTSLAQPGILVLTDVFYPGWEVHIDGEPAEVLRVDGVVRGVLVEEGTHTVVFRYLPASFLEGLILALVSGAFLLTLLFVPERKTQSTSVRESS